MSCPEAVRNVLLDPLWIDLATDLDKAGFRTDNFFWLGDQTTSQLRKPFGAFRAVQEAVVALVQDRSRPVWLRLLRVGALCQRLESAVDTDAALRELETGTDDQKLLALEGNRGQRLEVAMRLSDERLRCGTLGRRFQETYLDFVEGIARRSASDGNDDRERLHHAEQTIWRPFLEQNPQVLENYLINHVYQRLFPFGRAGGGAKRERGMFEEFAILAVQFGWLEMLLIGVAARYQHDFGATHLVKTIQSFHREVDHDGAIAEEMLESLEERGMHNLAGLAVMLR
jgi:lysine-N-methylase